LIASHKSPLIIGHRGASAVAPENTLASFARAFRDGADGIELDVRLARDGVPVVIHDATVPHTGLRQRRVAHTPSDKLQQIDIGSWFNRAHRRLARLEYTRQTIPTLDDVFKLLVNQPNKELIVYVEMKAGRAIKKYDKLAAAVVELVDRHQLQHRVVVISFNLWTVARIKELDSSIRTGALFQPRRNPAGVIRKNHMIKAALDCGASEILLHRLLATPNTLKAVLKKGLVPVVWTVEDSTWISQAEDPGVYALMTNDPARLRWPLPR